MALKASLMTARAGRLIRIMLVDDHEVVRSGLRMLIESNIDLQVVGETTTRATTLEVAKREQPDVILLDIDLGSENGLELIPDLRQVLPSARILVLTGIRDSAAHEQAVRQGAVGLVLKEQSARVLVQAIRQVHAGQAWLDSALIASVLTELSRARGAEQVDPEEAKIATLTEREREVISLICEGLKNKVVAERMSISDTTVRYHLTSIFAKLELENRLELVIYAYRNGLAQLPR
jgi:two-component system, NarL family, nitrate/nitrite response regulator NarL